MQTARIGEINYTLAQDRPTLVWLANLADIELHTSLSLAGAPERPTMLVFDLDPGPPAGIVECCEVALVLRGLFGQLGPGERRQDSGSKGMQVYLPLNAARQLRADQALRPADRRAARAAAARARRLADDQAAAAGKVLVDWSQNDGTRRRSTSTRCGRASAPTVSTPVSWEEVQACRDAGDPELLSFETDQVLARVAATATCSRCCSHSSRSSRALSRSPSPATSAGRTSAAH